jgi:hypothetical protein
MNIDGMIWIDPDRPFFGMNALMQVESVAEGDTILVHLPTNTRVEARSATFLERESALILSDVKNRALPASAQRSDWMQDGKTTRFAHVQNVASTGESRLTLSFRAVRKDTTVLVLQSGLIDDIGFYRTDSVTIITNPKTPVGLDTDVDAPHTLSLAAYPNPFNPTTVIRFTVGTQDLASLRTRLMVFDILGREVRTLVNDTLPAGEHSVRFDAGNLSSGVYVLVLDTDGQRLVRTLTLIK